MNVSFFNGYTTGVVSYDASAEDAEALHAGVPRGVCVSAGNSQG